MVFLAIDYGARRLGLALSDEAERLCWPLETLNRRVNDARGDIEALLSLVAARQVEAVVLGIPGGSPDAEATALAARKFAAQLQSKAQEKGLFLAVFETDERFSSAQANKALREAGVSSRQSRDSGGANSIDARAAAVFLQTFLEARPEMQVDNA